MATSYILIQTVCVQYNIEPSFLYALQQEGLVEIVTLKNDKFITEDTLSDLEKIIRLHQELHVNLEGIDVVFNLLEKMNALQAEVSSLKNKLYFYENR